MGKASSAKKVARAARAGGSRRPGQRRNLGFPMIVSLVVILGVSLVLFARSSRDANAAPRPQSDGQENADHWHAPYGLYFCDAFVRTDEASALVDASGDPLGIHTHGDGVIHIHPFTESASGRDARLRLFFDDVGVEITDSRITFPDGEVWDEDEDTCVVDDEEVPGTIQIAQWDSAQDAADGERPNALFTDDFGDIRFEHDGEYFTIGFFPEGLTDIPVRPDIISDLNSLTDVISATTTTPPTVTVPVDGSSTTVPVDPSATTAPEDPTVATTTIPASTTAPSG